MGHKIQQPDRSQMHRKLFGVSSNTNIILKLAPSSKKLSPGDCDNDRQPKVAILTFRAPILSFRAVRRCRYHLTSLLSSSSSSKMTDLPLEFQCYLSLFPGYKYFRFGWSYYYFRLSIVLRNYCISGSQLKKNNLTFFLSKRLEAFYTQSAPGARKNVHRVS